MYSLPTNVVDKLIYIFLTNFYKHAAIIAVCLIMIAYSFVTFFP